MSGPFLLETISAYGAPLERGQSFKELVFSHVFGALAAVEACSQRNLCCRNPYYRNGYCGIVLAVSELAPFLSRARTAIRLADDERHESSAAAGPARGSAWLR